MSRRQATANFEVSASSAVWFVKRYEDEGTVAVKAWPPRKRRLDPYSEDILGWIKEAPDLTLQELSQRLRDLHDVVALHRRLMTGSTHARSALKNRSRQ